MQHTGAGLIPHWSWRKMEEKVNKIYTCCEYDFVSLSRFYVDDTSCTDHR